MEKVIEFKNNVDALLIDLPKAFDCLNHNFLTARKYLKPYMIT